MDQAKTLDVVTWRRNVNELSGTVKRVACVRSLPDGLERAPTGDADEGAGERDTADQHERGTNHGDQLRAPPPELIAIPPCCHLRPLRLTDANELEPFLQASETD